MKKAASGRRAIAKQSFCADSKASFYETGGIVSPHKDALQRLSGRSKDWLFEACFPFWAERGVDPRGGFYEKLTLDGAPILEATSRVRVQARQTYVYAHAALLGWRPDEARALVKRGVDTMLGPCRRDDGLFGKMLTPGEGLADDQPELYDNAFCLMGLAWAARALADPALIGEAKKTLEAIDERLAHPSGGYCESLPARAPRRQNPHMHMFEASLALYEASKDPAFLARAEQIAGLLVGNFMDLETGFLREYFTEDLAPVAGEEGDIIEPGHQLEWTWLLSSFARAKGEPLPGAARKLYAASLPFIDARGFAPQTADTGGRVIDASRRSWPQTEAIKAHLALAEAGDEDAPGRAARCLESFFEDYLSGVPAGGWRDHFDAAGAPVAKDMPASTGYHAVLALAEFRRVFPS